MLFSAEDRQTPAALTNAMQGFTQRALAVQAEFAESLLQANRHWVDQMQVEWAESLALARRISGEGTPAEKTEAVQAWLKGATERGIKEASYFADTARRLGSIEMKMFSPAHGQQSETQKAA
jgi:hypothetical protein